MFLTLVKRLQIRSLTLKLVILYTISTLGILASLSLFYYSKAVNLEKHLNVEQMQYLRAECYDLIIITFLIGALGAMIMGYWVTRRGLSGIKQFANHVSDMSVDSLHQRLDSAHWPNELQYLGQTFNVMLDRIQQSFLQLNQFSADIAHELRTPIQHLMSMTELSLQKKCTEDEYQELLSQQLEVCCDLAKLIDDLLFLARSDYKQVLLSYEEFQARDVIVSLMEYYQILAEEKQIRLHCSGEVQLTADRILFKRVITNLLSNALRYTPEQGEVWIDLSRQNHRACITIRDTGIGIPNHHLHQLFDRCYRVDPARQTETGGLGLGLAIVKSILNLHNGQLSIQSEVQQGTTVQLVF